MAIKDYLVVDIEKPVATYVDLTNYFQGRVADAEAYCKLWIKSGSTPVDMTNKKLRFYGKDSNATPFVAAGHFDDDQPGDDRQLGLITFYFPEGIFQKEGKWQEAFFKIEGADGSNISTINLTLNVLPNQVEMGISIHPFIPILEETEAKINKALREMNAQQLLNQINSMKTTVGAYTDLIAQHAVLNKPQTIDLVNGVVNPMKTKLNGEMDSLKSSIVSQMSSMQSKVDDTVSKIPRWHSMNQISGTLLNGCSGWVSGNLMWNDDGQNAGILYGWVKLPASSSHAISFSTNPLNSYVNFGTSLMQTVVMFPQDVSSDVSRTLMGCDIDKNDNNNLGLWHVQRGWKDDQENYMGDLSYAFSFNLVFINGGLKWEALNNV